MEVSTGECDTSRDVSAPATRSDHERGRSTGERVTSRDVTASFDTVALRDWLQRTQPGESLQDLRLLPGGNSNETYLLQTTAGARIVRRPPTATIDPSAHSMAREHRMLSALIQTEVPAPRPLAFCEDPGILGAPFILMEMVEGMAPTRSLPDAYADDLQGASDAILDALAALHRVPWQEIGLADFGRPQGFLERQVARWRSQYARHQVRELPRFGQLADWLERHRPPAAAPAILHGDFHADNCLLCLDEPRVSAIIDWEMATIGDPLLDLGLFLAFWGPQRPTPPAMPSVQGFSRVPGAPSRMQLADRYAALAGRSVEHIHYYLALAFWKLAAIVEGAYGHYLTGAMDNEYSRQLGADVPRLLEEAWQFAQHRELI